MTRHCHECGAVQKPEGKRSKQQHNWLFAVIDAACDHWPHDYEFQPEDNPELLRAWLICKAGKWERKDVPIICGDDQTPTPETAAALQAAFRWAGPYPFVRPRPGSGSVAIYRAQSIKWSKLSQKDFAPLAQAIQEIIENVIGVPAEQLLREHEAAA